MWFEFNFLQYITKTKTWHKPCLYNYITYFVCLTDFLHVLLENMSGCQRQKKATRSWTFDGLKLENRQLQTLCQVPTTFVDADKKDRNALKKEIVSAMMASSFCCSPSQRFRKQSRDAFHPKTEHNSCPKQFTCKRVLLFALRKWWTLFKKVEEGWMGMAIFRLY